MKQSTQMDELIEREKRIRKLTEDVDLLKADIEDLRILSSDLKRTAKEMREKAWAFGFQHDTLACNPEKWEIRGTVEFLTGIADRIEDIANRLK